MRTFTKSPGSMPRPDAETAAHRAELAVDIQSDIMDEFNERRLGTVQEVLAEGFDRFADCWYGRSYADSPEVDGKVFFTGSAVRAGQFIKVRITDTLEGDLVGVAEEQA